MRTPAWQRRASPVKRTFWAEISARVPETALLTTNTPNLPVSAIAERVRLPERFMEQHWLNPPHLLPLCEIVAGEKTAERNVRQMREWVAAPGKCPVMVKDIPGFLINRIQGEPWSGFCEGNTGIASGFSG